MAPHQQISNLKGATTMSIQLHRTMAHRWVISRPVNIDSYHHIHRQWRRCEIGILWWYLNFASILHVRTRYNWHSRQKKKHNPNMIDRRNFGGKLHSLTDSWQQTGPNSMTAAWHNCVGWNAIAISKFQMELNYWMLRLIIISVCIVIATRLLAKLWCVLQLLSGTVGRRMSKSTPNLMRNLSIYEYSINFNYDLILIIRNHLVGHCQLHRWALAGNKFDMHRYIHVSVC